VAGTDSWQTRHVKTIVNGSLRVVHKDGTEGEVLPGDAHVIEPGHDAWVVGGDPVVGVPSTTSDATSEKTIFRSNGA
jgi:hypothetical protein